MTFFVWKHTPRGPVASIDALDPRRSNDWPLMKQTTIRIVPLLEEEAALPLDRVTRAHPCPDYDPDVIARAE